MKFWQVCRKKRHSRQLLIPTFSVLLIYFIYVKLHNQNQDENSIDLDYEEDYVDENLEKDQHIETLVNLKEIEMMDSVSSIIKNLPDANFLINPPKSYSHACGKFPDLYSIEFSNIYWQVQKVKNVTFFLYQAYFDGRPTKKKVPVIRILTMVDEPNTIHLSVATICQFWYQDHKTVLYSPVINAEAIWYKKWSFKGRYTAYMLTCPIPEIETFNVPPVSVSLVGSKCDNATNNLKIHLINGSTSTWNEEETKDRPRRFGVCVKGLDFLHEDKSLRLVEWIELLLILDVSKIFFYEFDVHPNVKKVLKYYEKLGKVDVTPLTLPGTFPNEPNLRHLFLSKGTHSPNKRKNEVVPYNDCLYRNLKDFDYLGILDTDEIIIPKKGKTWNDLISSIDLNYSNQSITSYCFQNAYFFDSLPEDGNTLTKEMPSYMHMLKHVYRSANYTAAGRFVKCIHSTARTKLFHNHFPLRCVNGLCNVLQTNVEFGHLQHFRSTCQKGLKDCEEYEGSTVLDLSVWKYKTELLKNVEKALRNLQLGES